MGTDAITRSERLLDITGHASWHTATMSLNDGDFASQFPEDNWDAEYKRPINIARWLLIEHSTYSQTWATLHATPEDAAAYHDGQECIEDWGNYRLYDLDTGDEFYPVITTTWEKQESL